MRVGTDAILLGAWFTPTATRLLDVGTGCGILALMMAQRFPVIRVDALDIQAEAVRLAQKNVRTSPWPTRMRVFEQDVRTHSPSFLYDALISNPPYFQEGLRSPDHGRRLARHAEALSHDEVLTQAGRLLTKNGALGVILPTDAGLALEAHGQKRGWYCQRRCRVLSRPGQPARRVMLHLCRQPAAPREETLCIHQSSQGSVLAYSEAFRQLTQDFYLSF